MPIVDGTHHTRTTRSQDPVSVPQVTAAPAGLHLDRGYKTALGCSPSIGSPAEA
jgi:hypothetical protein